MILISAFFFIYAPNIDIATGRDLREIKTDTTVTCENQCKEIPSCKGFVFSKTQGKCWLKDTLDGIKRINAESIGAIKIDGS